MGADHMNRNTMFGCGCCDARDHDDEYSWPEIFRIIIFLAIPLIFALILVVLALLVVVDKALGSPMYTLVTVWQKSPVFLLVWIVSTITTAMGFYYSMPVDNTPDPGEIYFVEADKSEQKTSYISGIAVLCGAVGIYISVIRIIITFT